MSIKPGDILRSRHNPTQTARVCRVNTFTVLLICNEQQFLTIPLSALWRTFERPTSAGAVAAPMESATPDPSRITAPFDRRATHGGDTGE